MTAEGQLGYIAVYAEFTDGSFEDVTPEAILMLTDETESLQLSRNGSHNEVSVAPGAVSLCGPAIKARWELCNVTVARGMGIVMLDMPEAVRVQLSGPDKITVEGDGAALAPFDVPSAATFTATVHFEDGSSQDFSRDSRTVYTVVVGGESVTMRRNVMVGVEGSSDDSSENASAAANHSTRPDVIALRVAFPDAFPWLNASANITLVRFERIVLRTGAWPAPPNSGARDDAVESDSQNLIVLRPLGCSGVYQRLEAQSTGVLSDGTARSDWGFFSRASYASSNGSVAAFGSEPCLPGAVNCRGLVPMRPGATTLTATWAGKHTSRLDVAVVNEPVAMANLTIEDTMGTNATLHGVANTTDVMEVTVAYEDGTVLTLAEEGQLTSAWLPPSLVLSFHSARGSVISVSAEGRVTLHANYYKAVTLGAEDKCGSGSRGAIAQFANLDPGARDVDLGLRVGGAPFGVVRTGEAFDVDVRVMAAEGEDLNAFQVIVLFDDDRLPPAVISI